MNTGVTRADGYGERTVVLQMLARVLGGRTIVAGDKGYDVADFVAPLRRMRVTAHVAQYVTRRRSAIDPPHDPPSRLRREPAAQTRRRCPWLVEDYWMVRKLRHRAAAKAPWVLRFAAAACNLTRMRTLVYATP